MTTTVYLVRHAETQFNVEGRLQGHSDSPLTPLGRRQTEQLAVRLSGIELDACYASTSPRAITTAQRALGGRQMAVRQDPRLREMAMGEWEGVPFDELSQRFPNLLEQFRSQSPGFRAPGGETWLEVQARMVAAVDDIAREHRSGRVLVVSHGAAVRMLLAHCLSPEGGHRELPRTRNCSLSILEWEGGTARVELRACDRHLDPLPTS